MKALDNARELMRRDRVFDFMIEGCRVPVIIVGDNDVRKSISLLVGKGVHW